MEGYLGAGLSEVVGHTSRSLFLVSKSVIDIKGRILSLSACISTHAPGGPEQHPERPCILQDFKHFLHQRFDAMKPV